VEEVARRQPRVRPEDRSAEQREQRPDGEDVDEPDAERAAAGASLREEGNRG
jgi:hypothetical protein